MWRAVELLSIQAKRNQSSHRLRSQTQTKTDFESCLCVCVKFLLLTFGHFFVPISFKRGKG